MPVAIGLTEQAGLALRAVSHQAPARIEHSGARTLPTHRACERHRMTTTSPWTLEHNSRHIEAGLPLVPLFDLKMRWSRRPQRAAGCG